MSPHRLRADDGFGLVELLVTMLIIGILVAIAVPSMLNQRSKAQDANAKSAAATAAKAATAYGTQHDAFDALTPADLVKVDKSLEKANELKVEGAGRAFTVSVTSAAGTTFSASRAADGALTRDCTPAGTGGCREGLDEHGNRW